MNTHVDVRKRRPARVAAITVAMTMAAGLFSSAAVAQSEDEYYGCIAADETLAGVGIGQAPGDHCGAEPLIEWNAEGPQGPKGEKGDKGNKGEQGEKGNKGAQGEKAKGAQRREHQNSDPTTDPRTVTGSCSWASSAARRTSSRVRFSSVTEESTLV